MTRSCAGLLLALSACVADDARARPQRPTPDKAGLYGDATLVPTREGEHARRELARAGEIEAAIRLFPAVSAVHVTVEAGPADDRVVVALRVTSPDVETALREDVAAVVAGVVGTERPHALVVVVDAESGPTPREGPAPLALALALVGLGASGGIALDRVFRLRRRRSRFVG